MAANTTRAYGRQWAGFTAWCAEHNRVILPATGETLAEYVTELTDAGRSPATIEQALAAIRTARRAAGHPTLPDTTAETGPRAAGAPARNPYSGRDLRVVGVGRPLL